MYDKTTPVLKRYHSDAIPYIWIAFYVLEKCNRIISLNFPESYSYFLKNYSKTMNKIGVNLTENVIC
jgi:hypothetical protein